VQTGREGVSEGRRDVALTIHRRCQQLVLHIAYVPIPAATNSHSPPPSQPATRATHCVCSHTSSNQLTLAATLAANNTRIKIDTKDEEEKKKKDDDDDDDQDIDAISRDAVKRAAQIIVDANNVDPRLAAGKKKKGGRR
jgi:hypothetical protein